MPRRATHYLLLLALLVAGLCPTPTSAQVLPNTLAVGFFHALCIRADGTLWGTGNNDKGELGNGTTLSSNVWTQLSSATNWTQVMAGSHHSLALRADGTLWAWGINGQGQLGTATNANTASPNPVPVQVPGTWAQVAAGTQHTLALKADGTLWAWGDNYFGQLGSTAGNNLSLPHPAPTQIPGTWAQIAAGGDFSLALTPTGSLYAWGDNRFGQLANVTNNTSNVANPTPLQIGGTWTTAAAGGQHALALRVDGTLWAWGNNLYGQLGNTIDINYTVAHFTPTQVAGTWTRMTAGYHHNLALRADGTLWGWGFSSFGQLGSLDQYGTASTTAVPRQVAGTWVQAIASTEFSLGLQADGTLWSWGNNTYGQLGKGPAFVGIYSNPLPAATGTALPTRSTAGGSNFGLAIKGDGSLWAWGNNEYGQLGIGTVAGASRPTQVGTDRDWVQVVAGSLHSLALKANGTVWAWGYNDAGQLGLATTATQYTPALVSVPLLTSLTAGDAHSLGLMATGQVYAWGLNASGQLGTGTALGTNLLVPTAIPGGLQFASLAAGADHSLALKATGLLYVWGSNQYGQRGDGFAAIAATPAPGSSPSPLARVVAGQYFSLGRTATGQVYAWGQNTSGQTGSATLTTTPAPTLVAGLPPVRQVAAGPAHSLALAAAGIIYTWGANGTGQLAQNTFVATPGPVPAQEATNSASWAQLANGSKGDFSLVRTASGLTFASAGSNNFGQLGDGTSTNWPRFDRISPLVSLQPLPVLAAAPGAAFALAPNPTHGQATAVGLPAGTTLAVYDAVGRLVVRPAATTFSVAELPAGLYLVRATAPGQAPQTARLLVE